MDASTQPSSPRPEAPARRPNFVLVFCDDLGFGDVSLYGEKDIITPALEAMARRGVVLSNFYAAANICTPSRAGLLTGRYPIRTGLGYEVIMQDDDRGLPLSEITIARALKPEYATGLFGKWHLGHRGPFWPPTRHGFDRFFGIPYSHDMMPLALCEAEAGSDEVKTTEVDYPRLQQQFYEHAERFIEEHRDQPFFVLLSLSAPHLPNHPLPDYAHSSGRGAYGDVVREIDDIVGRLIAKLRALSLEDDTLVIFTSDNGPWFEGSAGRLRDRKGGGGYDGGYHVPFVAQMPGHLPQGVAVTSIAMAIDLLPTFCRLAGKPVPATRLDGRDITEVLLSGTASPHDEVLLFDNEIVVGIRTQRWKYIDTSYYRGIRMPLARMGYDQLYDLSADPGENYNVGADFPDVLADMRARMKRAKAEFAPLKSKEIPPVFAKLRNLLAHLQD